VKFQESSVREAFLCSDFHGQAAANPIGISAVEADIVAAVLQADVSEGCTRTGATVSDDSVVLVYAYPKQKALDSFFVKYVVVGGTHKVPPDDVNGAREPLVDPSDFS
jgi:hypothetical protein